MASTLLGLLLIFGCGFVVIAALGLLRFPDLYTRMHAAAKAGAFGGSIIFLVAAIAFGQGVVWLEIILIILFFYLTTPVASHMIGRAAYLNQTPLWPQTQSDRLQGKYDLKERKLRSD